MRQSYIAGIIILLALSLATAVTIKNKTATLTPTAENWYRQKGITPTYTDYTEGNYYWRCLKSNTDYNLPCSPRFLNYKRICADRFAEVQHRCKTFNNVTLIESEKETTLDNWMNGLLERTAQKEIKTNPTKTADREGEVLIGR